MSAPVGGEVLFDAPLEIDRPLAELWEEARPYGPFSPRKDMRRLGNILLREQYAGDFDGTNSLETLQAVLRKIESHFRQLQRYGMSVVSHVTAPIENLEAYRPLYEDNTVAFSASAYVPSLRTLDTPTARTTLPKSKVQEFVTHPLERYLDWVATSGETFLLNDIYAANQYGWQPTSGVVFLHDIDPFFHPTVGTHGDYKDKDVVEDIRQGLLEEFADIGR